MVQVIPQEESLSALLGRGLGTGVSTGLEAALKQQMEMAKMQRQQQMLSQALGFGQPTSQQGLPIQGQLPQAGAVQPSQEIEMGELSPQDQQIKAIARNPQAMMQLEAIDPNAARTVMQMNEAIIERQKMAQKGMFEERRVASEESKKYREKIEEQMTSLPDVRMASMRIEDALKSNDLKSFRNFWADYMEAKGQPGEYFRTSSGAALQSAVKEMLLGDIGRIKGGRPNQFIERQLAGSYPRAGYDPNANQKILAALNVGKDIKEKEVELYQQISDQYEARGKHIPGNIALVVNKQLKPYVIEREKQLSEDYRILNKPKPKKTLFNFRPKKEMPPARVRIINPNDPSQDYMVTPENAKKAQAAGWRLVK